MSPDVEHAVRHEVEHFAENAKIAVDRARGLMRDAVGKLKELRAGKRADDKADEVLDALDALDGILANDELFTEDTKDSEAPKKKSGVSAQTRTRMHARELGLSL